MHGFVGGALRVEATASESERPATVFKRYKEFTGVSIDYVYYPQVFKLW